MSQECAGAISSLNRLNALLRHHRCSL